MKFKEAMRLRYAASEYFSTGHIWWVAALVTYQNVRALPGISPTLRAVLYAIAGLIALFATRQFVRDYNRAPWSQQRIATNVAYVVGLAVVAYWSPSTFPLFLGMLASLVVVQMRLVQIHEAPETLAFRQ